MTLDDLQADVVRAAHRAISATQLSVAVGGTSAAGNSRLTKILFPAMVQNGYLDVQVSGRTRLYTATQKGVDKFAV